MFNAFQWNCFNLVDTCNIALILFLKCGVTKFRIPPPPLSHNITLRRPPPPLNVWRNLWMTPNGTLWSSCTITWLQSFLEPRTNPLQFNEGDRNVLESGDSVLLELRKKASTVESVYLHVKFTSCRLEMSQLHVTRDMSRFQRIH